MSAAAESHGLQLARWVYELGRSEVVRSDSAIRTRALTVLLDDLAAIVSAAGEPEVNGVARLASDRGRGEEATLIATGGQAERAWAALANGVACGWNELDEGYRPATCHGGLYTVPAAIAEAQATGATLGAVLTAVVTGYELATRAATALPAPRPPVLHPHATLSALGASGAICALRGLDERQVAGTIGAAASFACAGPFNLAVKGALVRNAWAGIGAWLGFAAADLAAAGLAGAPESVIDVFGIALRNGSEVQEAEISALVRSPGERLAILDGYHKLYACCQYAHSAVEAALELRAGPLASATPDELAGIREVQIDAHPLAMTLDNFEPATTLAGKFSLPHSVAAVLATGDATPRTFSAELLHDPLVSSIRRAVRIAPYLPEPTPPLDRPARVRVISADGTTHAAECMSSIGSPDRPLSSADILGKIEQVTHDTRPGFARVAERMLAGEADLDAPFSAILAELLTDAR